MTFEVTVLGSGAAIPTLERGATSHYVNCNNRHILIDCGEGTQIQLRKFKIRFQRITFICISHLHGDHFFGLVGLISTMQLMGRTEGLKIFGPVGIESIIKSQLELSGSRLDFGIEFTELEPATNGLIFEDNLIEIHHFPLKHRIATHGFRIQEKEKELNLDKDEFDKTGLSIAYIPKLRQGFDVTDDEGRTVKSDDVTFPAKKPKAYSFCSDTAYFEDIIPFIKGSDLLYHEATFTEKHKDRAKKTFHSTAKQAATIAKDAEVFKLIFGHFSARYKDVEEHIQEARSVFEKSFAVDDGVTYKI